jgi:hypothetical protein
MKITITINKTDIEHIKNCDAYRDACGVWNEICMKIKKKVEMGELK